MWTVKIQISHKAVESDTSEYFTISELQYADRDGQIRMSGCAGHQGSR